MPSFLVPLLWGLGALVACAIPESLGARSIHSVWGHMAVCSALGIATGLMIVAPRRAWLAIALGFVSAGVLTHLLSPHRPSTAELLVFGSAGPFVSILAAWLVTRACRGRPVLSRPTHVATVLLTVGVAGGALHAAADHLIGRWFSGSSINPWVIGWIRYTVCTSMIVPAIIALAEVLRERPRRTARQLLLRLVLVGITLAATLHVFSGRPDDWRAFALLLLPVIAIITTAFLSGPRLAALSALIMGIIAVGLTGEGQGPVAALLTGRDAIVGADLFVICTTALGLLTASAVADRTRLAAEVDIARERLELAVTGSHVGIWDWDVLNGRIHWAAAPGHSEAPGWPSDILTWEAALHPDDRPRVRQILDAHLRDGTPYHVDYRMRLGGDDYPWFRARGAAIRDADRRPVRMLGTLVDVTEELAAARRLAESEERFRLLTEISDDFIIRTDLAGRPTYVSPSVMRVFGLTPDELASTRPGLRVHPDDLPAAVAARDSVMRGESARTQLRAFAADGSIIWIDVRSRPLFDQTGAQIGAVSYGHDITALRQAQERTRLAEERYRAFITQSSEAIWRFDMDPALDLALPADQIVAAILRSARLAECNDAMAAMYGYARAEEFIGARLDALMPDDPRTRQTLSDLVASGFRLIDHETHEFDRFGRQRIFINNMVGLVEDGRLKHVWGTQRDVTERRRAEQALADAEARLRAIFELAGVGMAKVDLDGRFVLVNPALCRLLGRSEAELVSGLTFMDVTHPGDRDHNRRIRENALSDGTDRYGMRKRYLRPDGTVVWAELAATIVRDPAGTPLYQVSVVTDITDRMRAEAALAASELKYRELVEGLNVVAWETTSGTFDFSFVSGAAEAILGYAPSEWLAPGFWLRVVHPEDRDAATAYCMSKTREGLDHDFEYRAIHKDGRVVWIRDLVSVGRNDDGSLRLRGVLIDITQQKIAEQSRRDAEARFLRVTEAMEQVFWVMDLATHRLRYISPSFPRIWGYAAEDLLSGAVNFWDTIHPDDRARAQAEMQAARTTGIGFDVTYRIIRPDGRIRWIRDRGRAERSADGKSLFESGIAEDITHAREAEEAVRRSESRFRRIVETAEEGIWTVDEDWRTTFVNQRMADMLGYTPEAMLGRHIHEFMDDAARDDAATRMRSRERGHADHHDFRFRHADGRDVWVLISTNAIMDDAGRFTGALAMVTDITQRRQDELALRESERTKRAILAAMPDAMFVIDPDGRFIDYHAQDRGNLLVPPEQFLGRAAAEVLPHHLAALHDDCLRRLRQSGQPQSYEYSIDRRGETRWWEVRMVLRDDGCAISLVRNITERKRAEHALADSQRRLAALISQAPVGIIVWNTRFEIVQWNPAAERMFGFTAAQAVGKHGSLIVPPEARPVVDEVWRALITRRGGSHSINDNLTRSGARITCEWNNTPLVAADGAVIGVSSFVQDVTERVNAEQRQHLLMQELDHRVKNNMAAVLSLAEQTGRAAGSLDDFQSTFAGRVRALARMHNILAATRWRTCDLATLIRQTVSPYSGDAHDRLTFAGPDTAVPARAAQSLAITLNELATNAAKHGALSAPSGSVRLHWSLSPAPDGHPPVLTLHWLERGGPPTAPPSTRGLGMDLIEGAIIYQLAGKVDFRFPSGGLECDLVVPLKDDVPANPPHLGPDNPPLAAAATHPLPG